LVDPAAVSSLQLHGSDLSNGTFDTTVEAALPGYAVKGSDPTSGPKRAAASGSRQAGRSEC
jgi:hypothetical protein